MYERAWDPVPPTVPSVPFAPVLRKAPHWQEIRGWGGVYFLLHTEAGPPQGGESNRPTSRTPAQIFTTKFWHRARSEWRRRCSPQ